MKNVLTNGVQYTVPMDHPWKKRLFDKRMKLQQIREIKRQRKEQKEIVNASS
jgi:hypothetical protein